MSGAPTRHALAMGPVLSRRAGACDAIHCAMRSALVMMVGLVVGWGCGSSTSAETKTAPEPTAPAAVVAPATAEASATPTTESLCRELVADHGADDELVPRCVARAQALSVADLAVCIRSERWIRRLYGELVDETFGTDPPTAEEAIEGLTDCPGNATSPELQCAAAAADAAAATACLDRLIRAATAPSHPPSVTQELERIDNLVRAAHRKTGKFPVGTTGPTPPRSCCDMPQHRCTAADAEWSGPWSDLGFQPRTLHYQYAYDGDGTSATITAIADLDCDGITATYTLEARVVKGLAETSLKRPTNAD